LAEFRLKRKIRPDPDDPCYVTEDDHRLAFLVWGEIADAFNGYDADAYNRVLDDNPRAVSKFFRELAERLEKK